MFLRKFGLVVSAAVIGMGISSCFANVCKVSDQPASDKLTEFRKEWDDAVELAESTSRMALPVQINRLQEIKQKVERYSWSRCSQKAASLLTKAMDAEIDAFVMFLDSDTSDSAIQAQISRASDIKDSYREELYKLVPPEQKASEEKKLKQLHAHGYLTTLAVSQSIAYLKNSELETDFSKIDVDYVDSKEKAKEYYLFDIVDKTTDKITYLAEAKQRELRSYALIMNKTDWVVCETDKPSKNINTPSIEEGQLVCGNNSAPLWSE